MLDIAEELEWLGEKVLHGLLVERVASRLALHSLEDGILRIDQLYLAFVHLLEQARDLLTLLLGVVLGVVLPIGGKLLQPTRTLKRAELVRIDLRIAW